MEKVTVAVKSLAVGGAFVGEVIDQGSPRLGIKAFLRDVCPGEIVEAMVTADKHSYLEATLLNVLEPSGERISPPCRHFGSCGGCDLQHLELNAQRSAKLRMVEESLRIQGKLTVTKGVSLSLADQLPGFGHRRRVTLHVNQRGEIGFYRPNSSEVVPVQHCLIAAPKINQAIPLLQPLGKAISEVVGEVILEEHQEQLFVLLKLRPHVDHPAAREPLARVLGDLFPEVRVGAKRREFVLRQGGTPRFAEIPVGHFSQVNELGNEALTREVLALVKQSTITELYAGSGNLTFPLGERGARVTAVEKDSALVTYGSRLAKERQLHDRIRFVCSSAERYVRGAKLSPCVLLDPPRSGAREVVRMLAPSEVVEVVYVSCNLPSLVRDLRNLTQAGYTVHEVRVIDMFPQTHHVECVAYCCSSKG